MLYTTYVGDGDSSSFTRIAKEKPYGPNVDIKKEECIGHVKKRMGTRLRTLVTNWKGNFCLIITFMTTLHPNVSEMVNINIISEAHTNYVA